MGSEQAIVTKLDTSVKPTCFEVTPFVKPRKHGEPMHFEVNLVADSLDKMRKIATVEPNLPSWGSFSISCDEGLALGGEDSAPPPLGYLASGVAFCLLTHLTSYVRAKKLDVRTLRVEQRIKFRTALVTDSEKEGEIGGKCDGLETYIVIDSDEPQEKIDTLIDVSQKACMALQAMVNETPQTTSIKLNGTVLE